MDRVLKDKRVSLLLIIVCLAAYIILNFTRSAYTAALAGIIKDGIFSKTNAGQLIPAFGLPTAWHRFGEAPLSTGSRLLKFWLWP